LRCRVRLSHAPEVVSANRSYLITSRNSQWFGMTPSYLALWPLTSIFPPSPSRRTDEAAAVLNYVLANWGNGKLLSKDFKPISADEVKAERGRNLSPQQVYEIRQRLSLAR
jgi:hypothetical protein